MRNLTWKNTGLTDYFKIMIFLFLIFLPFNAKIGVNCDSFFAGKIFFYLHVRYFIDPEKERENE